VWAEGIQVGALVSASVSAWYWAHVRPLCLLALVWAGAHFLEHLHVQKTPSTESGFFSHSNLVVFYCFLKHNSKTHRHTDTQTHRHTDMRTLILSLVHSYTYTHTYTHTHIHTHTYIHIHTHTFTHTLTHTPSTDLSCFPHLQFDLHIYIHIHIHIHIYIYIHTQISPVSPTFNFLCFWICFPPWGGYDEWAPSNIASNLI